MAGLVDEEVARGLWESLAPEYRQDHFDDTNMPERYRQSLVRYADPAWARARRSTAISLRELPAPITWELAWLLHREVELGRRLNPSIINRAARVLRAATRHGGPKGRGARSLLALTADEWLKELRRARLKGSDLGPSNDDHALHALRRMQEVLVYAYERGEWWRLNIWNPQLDPRIPRREHEPNGRQRAIFAQLEDPWLREAAKWWLSICLETERYGWSSVRIRLDGLKWLQRHLRAHRFSGPQLVEDPAELRPWVRGLLESLRTHVVILGPTAGSLLGPTARRQTMVTIGGFYRFMYDHRAEAAEILDEPRWLILGPEYTVLIRPEDTPRHTNALSGDLVLEDDTITQIAQGAELLARPKDDGGLGDTQAFHALMLVLRTGRRINEVLLMEFEPLLPLISAPADDGDGALVARLHYQQTKVRSGAPATIPVDVEIVAIVRAQQQLARQFMADQGCPEVQPAYLFLRERVNRFGRLPYSAATLHSRLSRLSERLALTDSVGRPVRISRTHRFRHTRATNLLNAGVPLHVVMRHFGHVTPAMTMHYARTLSETAEREFLRYKKITADARPLEVDPSDLYDVLHLDQRADRILPNGWCMLPPKQSCTKGNACLSCDKFATDVTHRDELRHQRDATVSLIDRRNRAFLARYGTPMPDDNVWLAERSVECSALDRILVVLDSSAADGDFAVRGAGVPSTSSHDLKEAP